MGTQVGIIGTGGIAKAHLDALGSIEDVSFVAFCDVVEERAKEAAQPRGAKVFTDAGAMLDECKLDAVWICLPPFAHGEAERQALAHGVPFFVEKPVGLDAGICREIAAEVQRTKLLTCVGYMNRYRHSIQRGREVLKDSPPVLAYGGWLGGAPRGGRWWVQKDKSGGQLVEQTTHTVDLARYLCGDAVEVFAHGTRGFNQGIEGYTIEDASIVSVRFANGALADLMSSCACGPGTGVFLNIYSPKVCLKYTGWEHSVTIQQTDQEPETIKGEDNIFAIEDRAFLQAVRTGDRSHVLCDYPDGWKTAELALAANESMETGKAVSLQ